MSDTSDQIRVKKPLQGVCYFHSETGTEGGFWAFQDNAFIFPSELGSHRGAWLREGLHLLKAGDRLTIYAKDEPTRVVWTGVIEFVWHPPFKQSVFNCWIHNDQVSIYRETWARWFFDEFPAELIPKAES